MNAQMQSVLAALKKRKPEEYLVALLGILVLLILAQGIRCGAALIGTSALLHSLEQINAPPARKAEAGAAAKYEIILNKGILGRVSKNPRQELRVFGILGNTVLMGLSPENIKPYEIGAEVQGGEELVKIEASSVILEKDGKQRTIAVFPEEGAKTPEEKKEPAETGSGSEANKPPGADGKPGDSPAPPPPPGEAERIQAGRPVNAVSGP